MTNNSILGIGNDIVEIERIRKSVETHKERFLERLFTQKEQAYCRQYSDPFPHLAARFAGKEAIAKALGCGFGGDLSWLDLEIVNDEKGKPLLHPSPLLKERFHKPIVLISLSHSDHYATAIALWISSSS